MESYGLYRHNNLISRYPNSDRFQKIYDNQTYLKEYNEKIWENYDNDFKKEEIINDWYLWRDENIEIDIPNWVEIIDIKDLDIINYNESILKKVIQDKNGNYYKIVKLEYEFLKKYDLLLPETHWLDRIKSGLNFIR